MYQMFNHRSIDVNKAYTSKTVSWTGEIIKSRIDGKTMNRDLNGARGI